MSKTKKTSLIDFPEEVEERNGVNVYGETSYENQMAVLSYYLHNHHLEHTREEQIRLRIYRRRAQRHRWVRFLYLFYGRLEGSSDKDWKQDDNI